MSAADLSIVAVRALDFWAVAVLLGGAGFILRMRHASRYARNLMRTGAIVAALSGLAWFCLVFASVMGGAETFLDREAWQTFLAAPFGLPWAIRVALCFVAIGLVAIGPVAIGLASRLDDWLFLALGCGFAVDQAWLGHVAAASGPTVLLQFSSYGLHVIAGFLWTGALVMICAISVEAGRVPRAGLALFSTIGVAVVATLLVTGVANAVVRGVTPANLLTTPYGQLVAVKAGLLAMMIVLALVNRRKASLARADAVPASLWLETALGLVVLGAAAALGVTPPPMG